MKESEMLMKNYKTTTELKTQLHNSLRHIREISKDDFLNLLYRNLTKVDNVHLLANYQSNLFTLLFTKKPIEELNTDNTNLNKGDVVITFGFWDNKLDLIVTTFYKANNETYTHHVYNLTYNTDKSVRLMNKSLRRIYSNQSKWSVKKLTEGLSTLLDKE